MNLCLYKKFCINKKNNPLLYTDGANKTMRLLCKQSYGDGASGKHSTYSLFI